jgi:non-ribosomal peptide synthetase-like protein
MEIIENTPGSSSLAEPQYTLAEPREARSLLDIFADAVDRYADRTAIDAGDAVLTYAQLADAADRVADRLRDAGVGPGDRVGVRLPSGESSLYVGILGVLRAGGAYVPVDADDPDGRAETIWKSAGVCGVLRDDLSFTASGPIGDRPAPVGAGRDLTADDDAWIIFTSGSTGAPKGVAVGHRAATAFVDAEAQLWTVLPEDRVLAGLSVSFDASCEEMWLAWANGAALVPAPRVLMRTGVDLGTWLAEHGVTVISTVPTLAAMWDEAALSEVRLLILGGEACPPELGWRLAAGREVWNTYGPTEATVVTTAARIRPGEPVRIGWPLAGWDVAVVDESGEPVALGEPGELIIGGAGLGRYLDPELDAERYAGLPALGWERAYRSGDMVRETIEGLDFIGRRDHQVKLGGRRLELGEVEAKLSDVAGVRAAAAVIQRTAAANKILVGYVVGDVNPIHVRAQVAEQLPDGLAPLVIVLDAMPMATSGKVDRKALPWPPEGASGATDPLLSGTAAWLAERFTDQLGPVAMTADTDFFAAGANSLMAAKLVSALRQRFPAVAVADVYEYRRLGQLAARLDELGQACDLGAVTPPALPRRWGAVQLTGVLALAVLQASQWIIGVLAYGNIVGAGMPQLGWGWLIGGWLLLCSPMGRTSIVLLAKRALLSDLSPGRYSRHSWLACRVWFVEQLTEVCGIGRLAGTPWAERYARLAGAEVGQGARLGTIPQPASLVRIGARASIEADVDMHGWWIDGQELVVGEVHIGAGARVGTRALLMPGAVVGASAEIEPGSVVSGAIPPGERWGGAPARYEGQAGESWPAQPAARDRNARFWRAMFALGLSGSGLLLLLSLLAGILALDALGEPLPTLHTSPAVLGLEAFTLTTVLLVSYALLVAGTVRVVWRLLRPGWHREDGAVGWALWFSEDVLKTARVVLFPLFCSLYTRSWLRLMGLQIGRRTEISTAVGLNSLVSFGELSFATDDVVLSAARARDGWLELEPIEIGHRSFLGNGAILRSGTKLGNDSLVGLLTVPPSRSADGTCWLGNPALELPRIPDRPDPARTTNPPLRLLLARGAMDLMRILLPSTASMLIGWVVFLALDAIGMRLGVLAEVAIAPLALLAGGIVATALTVIFKWTIIGRYRCGEHPLWSFFVWRDELINSAQEQLASFWLMSFATATPLMSLYLRAMGAKVGRGVWCETMAITEFDLVDLGDGCVVNRHGCIETHLFHDRLMRIGPSRMGAGSTLGPSSAVLPDTVIGAGACVGGRSMVLRGEELPAGTRWHGAPVTSM